MVGTLFFFFPLLFIELNWLPLQSRITYRVALLVFKIHNDLAPTYSKNILLKQSLRITL